MSAPRATPKTLDKMAVMGKPGVTMPGALFAEDCAAADALAAWDERLASREVDATEA